MGSVSSSGPEREPTLACCSRTSSQPLTDAAAGRSPLVMHIHMVHMREFDLREGKAVARFEFHNSSDQTLHIDKIKPSCGCVTTRLNQPLDGYESEASGEFYLEVDTSAESSGQHQYDVAIHYHMGDKKDADAPSQTEQVVFRVDVPEKKVSRLMGFGQHVAQGIFWGTIGVADTAEQ